MIRIGIELNNVYRNINAQILKYVNLSSMNELLEPDDCDSKNMVVVDDYEGIDESMKRNLVKGEFRFLSKAEKERFLYEDYPLEIFGHAKLSETNLDVMVNKFAEEHDDVEIVFFSCNEIDLSMMSTLFFLSKTSTKSARKILFPVDSEDIWKDCDVVVTTDYKFVEQKANAKKRRLIDKIMRRGNNEKRSVVIIDRKFNRRKEDKSDLRYNSLSEAINDDEFYNKIKKITGK